MKNLIQNNNQLHYRHLLLPLIFVFSVYKISAQDIFYQQYIPLDPLALASEADEIESYCVSRPNSNEFAFFVFEGKTVKCFQVDAASKQYLTITTSRPKPRNIIGSIVDGKKYILFFSNDFNGNFESLTVDFPNNITENKSLEVKLKGEKFLETFTQNNKVFILSVKKQSSILRAYIFEGSSNFITKEFDFSNQKFSNNPQFNKLSDVLNDVQFVNSEDPNPLEVTSKKNKLYADSSSLHLTIDTNGFTKVVTISLDNSKTNSTKSYLINHSGCNNEIAKSNSFLYQNFLFMVKTCYNGMHFAICDTNTGVYLKDFDVTSHDEIRFKNSPIIQEGGSRFVSKDAVKELDKTGEFLRKVSNDDVGISVYNYNQKLEVKIGGSRMKQPANKMGSLAPIGYVGVAIATVYAFNGLNYYARLGNSYTTSRAVYFKSIFNPQTVERLNEEATERNPFDKIKDHVKEFKSNLTAKTIFKLDHNYVLGYYLKKEAKFVLVKFPE